MGGGRDDRTIRLWDTATGKHKRTLEGHTDLISNVVFSPDGLMLASGSNDRTIRLWDTLIGRHKQTLTGHTKGVGSVAFSPDGLTLASGSSDRTIRLWDVVTGEHKDTFGGVGSVAFSPDGLTLANGNWDKTIRLWDVVSGEHKQALVGHTAAVYSVAFSPDGLMLASGSYDGTVLLWHATPAATKNATVRISAPLLQSPTIGDKLTFSLKITDGENVAGYRGTVSYDSDVLRYVESANGDYLPEGAIFEAPVIRGNQVTLSATAPAGESDGDGTLATLTFKVLAVKPSILKLFAVSLLDSAGARSVPQIENTEIVMIDRHTIDPSDKISTTWGRIKTTDVFQNYPNPFNPETWFPYQLATAANVTLRIYSIGGDLVRTLRLGNRAAGPYQRKSRAAYWDGKNARGESVASGLYFYTFSAGDFTSTRRMLLHK